MPIKKKLCVWKVTDLTSKFNVRNANVRIYKLYAEHHCLAKSQQYPGS